MDDITEEIFANLGMGIDPPKEYALNISNYLIRQLREFEWFSVIQFEDVFVSEDSCSLEMFIPDNVFPINLQVDVRKSIDYTRSGLIYLTYDISVTISSEIECVTDKYYQAEEFLFSSSEQLASVYKQSIEAIEDNNFLLKGNIEDGIQISLIPLSSDQIDSDILQTWSESEKDKTNFKSVALEISNIPAMIDQHHKELLEIKSWFNSRGIKLDYPSFDNAEDGNPDWNA